jgi:hypothetical protein
MAREQPNRNQNASGVRNATKPEPSMCDVTGEFKAPCEKPEPHNAA